MYVRVRTRNERGSVVREGRSASGRRVSQVREFLEFPEELIEDWALEQTAEVLPLDPSVVDAQLAAQGRFEGLKPKQERDLAARVVEAGAGGAVEGPPLVGGSGAGELRGEERGTGGGERLGGPCSGRPVHAVSS